MACQAPIGGPPLLGCCVSIEVATLRSIRVEIVYNENVETQAQVWGRLLDQMNSMDLQTVETGRLWSAYWHWASGIWELSYSDYELSANSQRFTSKYSGYDTTLGDYNAYCWKYLIEGPATYCRLVKPCVVLDPCQAESCGLVDSGLEQSVLADVSTNFRTHIVYTSADVYPECCNEAP